MLAYPSILHTPAPRRVRFPQLDDEPRVAGVYLRVYVGGAPLPCSSRRFLRALLRGLHEETAALSAAHLTLVEGTVDAAARLAGVKVKGAATVKARAAAASGGKSGPAGSGGAGSSAHRDGGFAIAEVGSKVDPSLLLSKRGPGNDDGDGSEYGDDGIPRKEGAASGADSTGHSTAWDLARSYLEESDLSDDDEAAVAAAGGRRLLSPTALYRRHHLRCLVTLQALARFLEDSPGAPMPQHVFGALAVLLGLPQGRYPAIAAQGIDTAGGFAVDESGRVDTSGAHVTASPAAAPLHTPFSIGGGCADASLAGVGIGAARVPIASGASGASESKLSDGAGSGSESSNDDEEEGEGGSKGSGARSGVPRLILSLDTTYSIDNLPPLPAPLLLLLPPAAVFDLDDDPFRDAFIDATRSASGKALSSGGTVTSKSKNKGRGKGMGGASSGSKAGRVRF